MRLPCLLLHMRLYRASFDGAHVWSTLLDSLIPYACCKGQAQTFE